MDLVDLIQTRRFLGAEFLLWLWFKTECFEGLLETEQHGALEVWFDDKLTLEATLAETERNDFKGGAPAHSPEAKTALRQGKRPIKAKMGVVREGREWSFSIKSESMDLSGLKIPALFSREEEEQFYERMYLLEEIEDILFGLYKEFLIIRLQGAWNDIMLPAMVTWIQTDEVATPEIYPAAALEVAVGIINDPATRARRAAEAVESEAAVDRAAELAARAAGGAAEA
jgi:hypothetical protein